MRSNLIYGALTHISNRYQLCQLASKATRKLHKPHTRLQDTTNEVLVRFHQTSPIAAGTAKACAGISAKPLEDTPSASVEWLGSAYADPTGHSTSVPFFGIAVGASWTGQS